MQIRGRHWLVLWLFAFLAVAAIVLSRGTRSYQLARELDIARSNREALEAVATELQRGINEAAGRAAIGRAAESLGLRPATGAEMTVLPLPAPDTLRSR
jgi:hypothetical protein